MSRGLSSLRPSSPIPGWGLATGITVTLLSLVVMLPVGALLIRAAGIGPVGLAVVAVISSHAKPSGVGWPPSNASTREPDRPR